MGKLIELLVFGLLLGIRHAFEPDHLVAVSTMLTNQKSPLKAAKIGAFWGIGHTTSLFVVGLLTLLFRVNIPEQIAGKMEGLVGIMLIILGIRSILRSSNEHTHSHEHIHKETIHDHEHIHTEQQHLHRHKQSFLIGLIHGLAGSGALLILVLSTINSVLTGILYIFVFGVGSIIGMSMMTLMVGIPFASSMKRFRQAEGILRVVIGMLSCVLGAFIFREAFL
jgi:sulfite exporter TauE/SafE